MKRKRTRTLGPLLALLLFTAALWALHHELKTYSIHDILSHLHQLPRQALLAALLLTVLSYLLMTGYDVLALRYIRHSFLRVFASTRKSLIPSGHPNTWPAAVEWSYRESWPTWPLSFQVG